MSAISDLMDAAARKLATGAAADTEDALLAAAADAGSLQLIAPARAAINRYLHRPPKGSVADVTQIELHLAATLGLLYAAEFAEEWAKTS